MNSHSVKILGQISKIIGWLLLPCLALLIYASYKKDVLPLARNIQRDLLREPLQERTSEKPFEFSYRGQSYSVQPVADYRIYGLVVTHNNIESWADMYHNKDSVDLKDLCLIWGSNVIDDNFRKMSFHSESVSCHFSAADGETADNFNPEKISNNHLLSDQESIRQKIRDTHIGDQIAISGMLVNYCPREHPDWLRRSSTTRKDSGGGACEVVFVKDYHILKQAPRLWYKIYQTSKNLLIAGLIFKIILFCLVPWLDLRINR